MEKRMQLTQRKWSLSKFQRLLILLCAGLYLLVFRPWSEGHADGAASVYAGATAMVVLSVLPAKMRLIPAVALAIASAFVVLVAVRAVGLQA